jgi:hypothetical protein
MYRNAFVLAALACLALSADSRGEAPKQMTADTKAKFSNATDPRKAFSDLYPGGPLPKGEGKNLRL